MKNFLTLVIILTLIISCSKPSQNATPPQGGQDSGGGNTTGSTKQQVHDAIELAIKNTTFNYNLYNRMKRSGNQELVEIQLQILRKMTAAINAIPSNALGTANLTIKDEMFFISHGYRNFFPANKIKILEKGPCPASNNSHAEASVSSYSLDAELCFSLELLSKISQDAIAKEVMLLYVHEVAHMQGFDEEKANKIQDYAKKNYNQLINSQNVWRLYRNLLFGVTERFFNIDSAMKSYYPAVQNKADYSCKKAMLLIIWSGELGDLLRPENTSVIDGSFEDVTRLDPSKSYEDYKKQSQFHNIKKMHVGLTSDLFKLRDNYCKSESIEIPETNFKLIMEQIKPIALNLSVIFDYRTTVTENIRKGIDF